MSSIPSPERCIALLRQVGCSQNVIDHCCAVRDIAVIIAQKAHAHHALVEAGALLHDIGRATTHGITHAIEGARIAQELGLSLELQQIILRHIGAGIPRATAVTLGLPPADYTPQTLEEKIVAHADNLTDHNKAQPIETEIAKAHARGYDEYAQRLRALHDELSDICGSDINDLIVSRKK